MSRLLLPPKPLVNCFTSDYQEENDAFNEMINDPRWNDATSFRSQCQLMIEYLHNSEINVSLSKLGLLFGSRHCVQKQFYKIEKGDLIKDHGRPKLFTDSQHNELISVIQSWHSKRYYPSYDEIAEFVAERFHIYLDIESIRKYINNNCSFSSAIGVPFDSKRLECTEDSIDKYYDELENNLNGVHPGFVYNFDEVGFQEYVDSREVTVIVPENFSEEKVHLPYDRNTKRCSALVAIALDGENVKPALILNRKTIDSEIFSVLPQKSFHTYFQANGFITTAIFLNWWEKIFLPNLRLKRHKYNYYGPTIVICDGLKAHHAVLDAFNKDDYNIKIIYLPAHSSDQTQALDLGIFGFQKRISRFKVKPPECFSYQSKNIIRIITAIYRSTDPYSCSSAFRQAGIVLHLEKDLSQTVKVQRGCARAVRHYSPECIATEEEITIAQDKAESTRLDWDEIHKNSKRINII